MEWGLGMLVWGLAGEAAHTSQGAQNTTLPVGARARGGRVGGQVPCRLGQSTALSEPQTTGEKVPMKGLCCSQGWATISSSSDHS